MKHQGLLTAIIATVVTTTTFSAPHIKLTEQKLPDGRTAYVRDISMNTAKLVMRQCTVDNKKATFKKWGDYFFGLEFGRMNGTNGGWHRWEFIHCFEYNKGVTDLIKDFMPESVTLNTINNSTVVDLVYPSKFGGKLKMRMIQFPSHPDWMFLRVTSENFNLWRFDFMAYPGNTDTPRDRERHLRLGTQDFNLGEAEVKQTPQSPYIAMYNKFVQDNTGCFIIYEPEKFSEFIVLKTNNCYNLRMMVKKNVHEFYFALGKFTEKPANDMVNRFITEDGDAIRAFLKTINWEPVLPTAQFEKNLEKAKKLGISEAKLNELNQAYTQAVSKKDSVSAAKIFDELKKCMKNASSKGLEAFR